MKLLEVQQALGHELYKQLLNLVTRRPSAPPAITDQCARITGESVPPAVGVRTLHCCATAHPTPECPLWPALAISSRRTTGNHLSDCVEITSEGLVAQSPLSSISLQNEADEAQKAAA